jgi:FkbM family methyltransferase
MADIDLNEGAIWACRLLLNREPENQATIDILKSTFDSPEKLRAGVLNSTEFAQKFEAAGRPPEAPRFPVNLREGTIWGFRLLLGREPKDEQEIVAQMAGVKTIGDLREKFLFSEEFLARTGDPARSLLDFEVVNRFAPFCQTPGPAGFFTDFLGTKTRVSYLPAPFAAKSGTVEGGPYSKSQGMHGPAEWIATLRSVVEAQGSLVAIELGAGWAPWLVAVAAAAKKRGIDNVKLIGVEGSEQHFGFVRQHFLDNGLDPDAHQIFHAVVGAEDGIARFPILLNPSDHYGANAVFGEEKGAEAPGLGGWEEIKCLSLNTILDGLETVDLIHIDVQGSETDVFRTSIERVNQCVRRIVIGTHSRKIEDELFDLFSHHGWELEFELPCAMQQLEIGGKIHLIRDGEQIWRNKKLAERVETAKAA